MSNLTTSEINDALDVAECAIHDQVKDPNEREWLHGILRKLRTVALGSCTPSAERRTEVGREVNEAVEMAADKVRLGANHFINEAGIQQICRALLALDETVSGDIRKLEQLERDAPPQPSTAEFVPPTDAEIAAYRDLFRAELDKNMNNSSASPSTDAHRVALHRFVEKRNAK